MLYGFSVCFPSDILTSHLNAWRRVSFEGGIEIARYRASPERTKFHFFRGIVVNLYFLDVGSELTGAFLGGYPLPTSHFPLLLGARPYLPSRKGLRSSGGETGDHLFPM